VNFLQLQNEYQMMLGQRDPGDGSILASLPDLESTKRQINESLQRLCSENDFPFLRHEARVHVRDSVTAGTITTINGSTAITGAGTAWDRTMEGQRITVNGELNRIRSIPAGSPGVLTLENQYTGTGAAGQSYQIDYDVFDMPYDFMKMYTMRQLDTPAEIGRTNMQFEVKDFLLYDTFSGIVNRVDLDFNTSNEPYYGLDTGVDGTAVATNGSATVTGTLTVWDVQDIEAPGASFRFQDDDDEYLIEKIVTGTSLTLDRPYRGTTVAPAKGFFINPAGRRRFRVFDYPDFDGYVHMEYKRRPIKMVQDIDTPVPIPVEYHHTVLLKRALIDALQLRRLPYQDLAQDYEKSLFEMKKNADANISRHGSRIHRIGEGPFPLAGQIRSNQLTTN